MKRYLALVLLACLVALGRAQAQSLDDDYVHVYSVIQQADSLKGTGQSSQALAKYLEAQAALQAFQRGSPDWHSGVVNYRLTYLAGQIAALSAKVPPPSTPVTGTAAKAPNAPSAATPGSMPSAPNDWENQLTSLRGKVNQLQEQMGQMQSDKTLLEAKLKEAFAAQPAAVDPRELAKTQEQVRALQKENDLLKVSRDLEKTRPAVTDTKALEQAQQSLAEANRKLSAQTDKANSLAQEKKFLQEKLSLLAPGTDNAAALETTRKALMEANRQLAEQKEVSSRLALEKDALQAHIQSLARAGTRPAVADDRAATESALNALRAENALLKRQLASVRTNAPVVAGQDQDLPRQLAEAQTQLASLQSDRELWRLEKVALENRVRQLQTTALAGLRPSTTRGPVAPVVVGQKAKDAERIKDLEQERDLLQRKLQAAMKELTNRKSAAAANRVEELENQLATLRARLDSFEARQVPYTSEELALFKKPAPKPAVAEAKPKSVQDLPPATAKLVVEGRGYFSAAEYDKAEAAYQEAARQDQKNVPILANLAAIQIELNRLDAAEANLKQAIALKPQDPYTLFVLGNLKFRQAKYDDALDALSRAAKLDPQNPEVQNYLGLTLSEKGMRIPAEAALRKAVELDPNYGSAHNNLAVIYITQQPPAVEMARLHYQKALSAGAPHNAELEKLLDRKTAEAARQ